MDKVLADILRSSAHTSTTTHHTSHLGASISSTVRKLRSWNLLTARISWYSKPLRDKYNIPTKAKLWLPFLVKRFTEVDESRTRA